MKNWKIRSLGLVDGGIWYRAELQFEGKPAVNVDLDRSLVSKKGLAALESEACSRARALLAKHEGRAYDTVTDEYAYPLAEDLTQAWLQAVGNGMKDMPNWRFEPVGFIDGIWYRAELIFDSGIPDVLGGGYCDIDRILIEQHGPERFDAEAMMQMRGRMASMEGKSVTQIPGFQVRPQAKALAAAWREVHRAHMAATKHGFHENHGRNKDMFNPHLLPKVRSEALRSSAKGQPCSLRLPFICNRNEETTVLAHMPVAGKGMGTKVSDLHGAFACSACHDAIDRHTYEKFGLSKAEVARALLNGMAETQSRWVGMGLIHGDDWNVI